MKNGRIPRTHSNPLIRLGIYVFAAYIAVSLITLQMQINQKKLELKEIEAQNKAAYQQQQELRRQLELGDDGEHIARIARDKLDMGYADEHVYRDVSGS